MIKRIITATVVMILGGLLILAAFKSSPVNEKYQTGSYFQIEISR